MKSKWIWVLALGVLGAAVYGGIALATPPTQGVTTTILAKALFDDINVKAKTVPADVWKAELKTRGLSDVYAVDNKIPPGGNTGWHTHPGPSLILVVSGTVTNYMSDDPSCTPHAYSAGQGFIDEGSGDVHILRNESSTTTAETIAVQLLPTGAARKTDAPAPGNCRF